ISGQVTYDGNPPYDLYSDMELYICHPGGISYTLKYTTPLEYGSFTFWEVQEGNYLLKAIIPPDDQTYTDALSTYYGDTYRHGEALVLEVGCADTINNITIALQKYVTPASGNATIAGTIYYFNNGLKAVGDPVPGAEVYIEQEPNDEPVANTETDSAGYYGFTGLGDGLYTLYVDIPGLNMVSTYQINTADTVTSTNLNFYVDTVSGLGISTDSTMHVRTFEQPDFSVSIYPNPYSDYVNISLVLKNKCDITVDVLDAHGRILDIIEKATGRTGRLDYRLDRDYGNVSFVRFRIDNTVYLKKLIRN
ncbi:MAG: hypothetical protein KJ607_04210, partial [Bacteroidetes bacterium]|nr:hypothetical protein [Bacteroidota bacterium]